MTAGSVSSIRARTVVIPLGRQVSFSTRSVSARAYTLVRVDCTDGSHGLGVVQNGGTRFAPLVADAIRGIFAPLLEGRDAYLVEGIWADLYQEALHSGRQGAVMRALSAVDIALWDRNARVAGLPLWKFLGGHRSDGVPAYASGGYYDAERGIAGLLAEIESNVAAGYRAFKIKVGGAAAELDVERARLVREAIGPDAALLLDANNRWQGDLPGAVRAIRTLEEYEPYWLEEPFGPDEVQNHARLRQVTSIPVATGELLSGRWAFQSFLMAEAASVLNPDAGVCGGVTEFRRIAATASSFGIPIAPHSLEEIHVHLAAATPNTLFVEQFPGALHPLRVVLEPPIELGPDGRLRLPLAAGLGFDLLSDAVDQHAIEPWR